MKFLSKDALVKNITLISIDFQKPWWQLLRAQRGLIALIALMISITHIFWYTTPFVMQYLCQHPSLLSCALLFIFWILIDTNHVYARQLNARFQLQCIHSIYQSAHQRLLLIDPYWHTFRSSGTILGKIERGARGYEDLLDQITFDAVPLTLSITVMISALYYYSALLALIISCIFAAMIIAGYYFATSVGTEWEKTFIETDDAFRATAVENAAQVYLVRASFASDYMNEKLEKSIKNNFQAEGKLWLAFTTMGYLMTLLYVCSIFVLISIITIKLQEHTMSVAAAVGMIVAYIQSTKNLVGIIKPFRRFIRGLTAVKDLFAFMEQAGKQSYPVLGGVNSSAIHKENGITIKLENIVFNYDTAQLFNHHSLELSCPPEQKNKLFGIIGASGSGKTTLLSILGGQLNPTQGIVSINGTNIYTINDATRRNLIALQGQVASSVRGTVKYNLLFGLPEGHNFSDQFLLDILEKVGLLAILQTHNGLDTMLGEGAVNLSGGQRQRLNFAGLYLRAIFYKPVLILIDEPTSSLDELSEIAITTMINELAQSALTLVIAHRLRTIENAVGIIDLSLIKEDKHIVAYEPALLAEISHYYAKLINKEAH